VNLVVGGTKILLVSGRPHLSAQARLRIESRRDLVVVGEAENYARALSIAAAEKPDFIVVDVGADDDGALGHISDLVQATKHVLIVSDIGEETTLSRLKQKGVVGLVPREQLVGAIIRWLEHDKDESGTLTLTRQEVVVVKLVVSGLSNRRIAKSLSVSEAVVAQVLDSIFRKLKVRDRLELLIYSSYGALWRV